MDQLISIKCADLSSAHLPCDLLWDQRSTTWGFAGSHEQTRSGCCQAAPWILTLISGSFVPDVYLFVQTSLEK